VSPPLRLEFVLSARDLRALPPTAKEIAVAGRSNVGKSSLINAIANRKDLAHTSKTPGRTQLLNLFSVEGGGTLVDLPGYGYAAVSARTRATWPAMIEGYLLGRTGLVMVMVLIDGLVGPTPLDLQTLEWLRSNVVPHSLVATKQDKVKPSQRMRRGNDLARACGLEPGDVAWVSASTGAGIEHLRSIMRLWL
jgi:GTP-binding protein